MALPNLAGLALHAAAPTGMKLGTEQEHADFFDQFYSKLRRAEEMLRNIYGLEDWNDREYTLPEVERAFRMAKNHLDQYKSGIHARARPVYDRRSGERLDWNRFLQEFAEARARLEALERDIEVRRRGLKQEAERARAWQEIERAERRAEAAREAARAAEREADEKEAQFQRDLKSARNSGTLPPPGRYNGEKDARIKEAIAYGNIERETEADEKRKRMQRESRGLVSREEADAMAGLYSPPLAPPPAPQPDRLPSPPAPAPHSADLQEKLRAARQRRAEQ